MEIHFFDCSYKKDGKYIFFDGELVFDAKGMSTNRIEEKAKELFLEQGIDIEELTYVGSGGVVDLDLDGETKSKRGNILFTPTVYEGMQILAELDGTSFNNLLHEVAKDYLIGRYKEVEEYKVKQEKIEKFIGSL